MPHYCCVPQCKSNSSAEDCKNLSFQSFPKDPELAKKWTVSIKRDNKFKVSKYTRICSRHFKAEDYELQQFGRVRQRLKKDVVPTVFNWHTPKPPRRKLFRHPPSQQPSGKAIKSTVSYENSHILEHSYASTSATDLIGDLGTMDSLEENEGDHEREGTLNTSSSSDESLVNVEAEQSPDKKVLQSKNLQLLQLRSEEKFTLLRFSNSDSDIRYYTGFQSFLSLSCFFQFLQPECNFLYYVGTDNTSAGTPYELLNKRGPDRALSPMEELFITLVRLRKGFPERHIGNLYNISEGHVSKIVNTWILFLADRLSHLPIWPSKEHVRKTMPVCFRAQYPTTRAIVDCTELFIEQPSAAGCQRETFSSYKHHNTAKGLIAITPEGQISFISQLYAGRCSDKKIIRHCGILDLLEEGDSLMADKGFDIADDLEKRGVSLTMPPFLRDQDQFTEDQVQSTRSIAAVRVHVERAVRKVKEFEILRNIIPISLCPMLDRIWTVCAHLANFTGALIKKQL